MQTTSPQSSIGRNTGEFHEARATKTSRKTSRKEYDLRLVFTSDGDRVGVVSHKLDGRITTFPFSSDSAYDSVAYDPVKTRLSVSEAEENQPITMLGMEHCDLFILQLLLPTPTMQFSLDRKLRSQKWNRYSASDSDLIFTRSYHSSFLITTPTPTQSLVKTSL